MFMSRCHRPTKTYYANCYLSARIEAVTRFFLFLLLNFSVLSANAQWQREQIVFVSQGDESNQLRLTNGLGGLAKNLTLQGFYFTPSLSFDGKRVAFVSFIPRGQNGDIFIMDIRSREQRRVTFSQNHRHYNLDPSWAPDGSRIVFASNFDGDYDLYTVDEKGKYHTRLTDSEGDDVQPDWSPDGSKIVFASDQHRTAVQVWSMDVKTGHQQILTESRFPTAYPRWSPDGTQVAYHSSVADEALTGGWQIWQVRTDGTDVKSLIVEGESGSPAISPDGKQIAFSSKRDDNTDIYIFDRDSLETRRLTRDPSPDYQPSWSPDGRHLVFVSDRTGNPDIHKMNAEGGGIVNLTQSETSEYMPAWSPGGDKISFVRVVDGRWEIHVMDNGGNRQMRLDNSPVFNGYPSWSPQGDKIAFVNTPEQDSKVLRIYTIDPDGQNKQLLYETLGADVRSPRWSPDGKKMLFVYWSKLDQGIDEIRILDVMTRKVVNSIHLMEVPIDSAVWAPIGRTIVFTAFSIDVRRIVRYGIFLVDADGNNQEPLWHTFSPQGLYYGGERLSWSPDGQSILFSRGTGHLYVTGINGGGVKLFLRNAHSPDWKTPVSRERVTAENKLHTTWGEVKK